MEKIYLSDKEYLSILENTNSLNRYSHIHFTNDDTVIKEIGNNIYNCSRSELEKLNNILDQIDLLNESKVVFPNKIFIVEGIIKAYEMKFVNGIALANVNGDTNIINLLKGIKKVEKIAESYADKGIIMNDMHMYNIIYNFENEFEVIDTDLFTFNNIGPFFDNLKKGLSFYNYQLMYLFNMKNQESLNTLMLSDCRHGKEKISNLIERLLNYYMKEYSFEIKTLDDIKNPHRQIKQLR